jgi:predicted aspartyl protease
MPDMGTFRTTIMIENVERRGEMRTVEDALVDTGSEYTWVPADVLAALGVRPERSLRFIVADGRSLERQVGIAIVHAAGAMAPDFVVFAEPGDMILLGARSLEGLNVRVDAQRKQLVPAGPILAGHASPMGFLRRTESLRGQECGLESLNGLSCKR